MKKIGITLLFVFFSFFLVPRTFAYKTIDSAPQFLNNATNPTGLSKDNIETSIGRFIQVSLLLVGTIFLGLMIYGGFTWMTARGSEEKITKAKETIVAAAIGIAVILGAYAATNFITNTLINPTSVGGVQEQCGNNLNSCIRNCNNEECRQTCDERFIQCMQNP